MPLLNYTSRVPAHASIAEIGRMLAKAGASAVMYEYDDAGNIVAISFKLKFKQAQNTSDSPLPEIAFRLPSDWRPVHALLIEARKKNTKIGTYVATEDHARDVAWRIIKDWVEAQLAIIETRMVTTAQVFLPYAVTPQGQTLYEYIAHDTRLLLGEGKE